MGRFLITLGLALLAAGLIWPWLARLGLGRLPGDIVVARDSLRLHLPITTGILLGVMLALVLWLFAP